MTRYAPQWLQAGSYPASVDRRLVGALWPAAASTGCAVTVQAGMTVNVAAGQVAVPTQNNTGTTLCSSDAVEPVTLAAAPASGSNRYDLVICQPRGQDLDGGANNDFIFTTVTGTAAATPTVPAVPAGAVALAQIYVPGGSASVTAGNITDRRPGFLSLASTIAPAQAAGTAAVTFSAGTASNVVAVTFPAGRFSTPPRVFASADNTGYWANASNATATGCNVRGFVAASQSATINVNWYATAAT